ncbi:MAG TPA: AI-2E family transporter [Burkholderiaceae bacterium]
MLSDQSPHARPGAPLSQPERQAHAARVMLAVAIVALVALAVYLRAVIVLAFGSVVVAVALRTGSHALRRVTGWGDSAALAAVVLGTSTLLTTGVVLLGDPIGEQFATLGQTLPAALEAAVRWLDSHTIGLWLLAWWSEANDAVEWTKLAGLAGNMVGALGGALLMLVVGLYLAADPALYRRGLLWLLPQRQRASAERALAEAGHGLSRWLLGQAVAMVLVGALTAAGLALIGMPLAVPLGIIAGLLEFVPFFGAIAAGALTVLVAFSQGAAQAGYAVLVCVFVQHFEGYVIQPFVQRWAIALPPALGLISVLVFGLLFGALGVLFAVPLMVVLMVLVRELRTEEAAATVVPPGGSKPGHGAQQAATVGAWPALGDG